MATSNNNFVPDFAAARGLIDHRFFLAGAGGLIAANQAKAEPLTVEPWMRARRLVHALRRAIAFLI